MNATDRPSIVTPRGALMQQAEATVQNLLDAMDGIARGDVTQFRRAFYGAALTFRAAAETLPDAIQQIEKERP